MNCSRAISSLHSPPVLSHCDLSDNSRSLADTGSIYSVLVHQPLVHHFSLQAIISLTPVTFPIGRRVHTGNAMPNDRYRDRAERYLADRSEKGGRGISI